MEQGGFDGIIGQDAAVAAFRAAFDRARRRGCAGGALIMGRKGGGKTAFIKAAAADTGLPTRYADCGALNRAGLFGEFVYSGIDRRGGFQRSLFGDEYMDFLPGDRALTLDNLGALNKRGRDALSLLMRESKIKIGRTSYRLPFQVWIAASADTADAPDKPMIDSFGVSIGLAGYAPDDLLAIASDFASAELRFDYSREALAMAISPPRDVPGEATALLREADRDMGKRGVSSGSFVDGLLMREALERLDRTPCGLLMDEYRYLAALDGMGGYGRATVIAKRLGMADGRALMGLEARMDRLGLIERGRSAREITALGEERLEAARASQRLIDGR